MHYHRVRKHGDPGGPEPLVNRRELPLQGFHLTSNGYRRIRVDGQWVLEHRHVMEKKLGRPLYSDESVHHIDGDKTNNDPENLELWLTRQPTGIRTEDALAWAREIVSRYG